jgi:hypothetical protein
MTRRQRKRPGWQERRRQRCRQRRKRARLLQLSERWPFVMFDKNRLQSSVPRTPTCGQCGHTWPERPCGNPCNHLPW